MSSCFGTNVPYYAFVSHTVPVFYLPTKNISDGLDSAMRMPRETFDVIPWIVCTKIIEKQEWVERRYLAKTERPLQVDTSSFDSRFAFDDLPDLSIFSHLAPPRLGFFVPRTMWLSGRVSPSAPADH